ncbi:MAG TPA: TonB-dependent receptor, partial [Aquabacterium sp.]|nr:TonB-dependent receptor [Aquabacterium sp.]
AYQRSSLTATLGWTPDRHTRLELSALDSQAEAAYGDRSMDGSVFDRRHVGIKFEKSHIGTVLDKIEAQWFENDVDHVMDNYSLRTPPASTGSYMASNPDRLTTGGRLAVTLRPNDRHKLVLGLDQQDNVHTLRKSGMGGELAVSYASQRRTEDARFGNLGLFGEVTHLINDQQRVVGGLRQDHWEARDQRQTLSSGMMSLGANPTAGQRRDERLTSGFIRYEHDLSPATQALIGLGHTQRAPDYWELIGKEGANSTSVFDSLRPEKTTQLDIGLTHQSGPWQAFVSGFVSQVDDYILIQTNVVKPSGMGTRSTTIARNVDARTWGAEAGVHYAFNPQ